MKQLIGECIVLGCLLALCFYVMSSLPSTAQIETVIRQVQGMPVSK